MTAWAGQPKAPAPIRDEATEKERPRCDTPGCNNEIPLGGEGYPEICPKCLEEDASRARAAAAKDKTRGKHGHYFKAAPFEYVDIYRVLQLFAVTDPCLQHAVKKILMAGGRGAGKDIRQDIQEAIDTLTRWQEMRAEESAVAS